MRFRTFLGPAVVFAALLPAWAGAAEPVNTLGEASGLFSSPRRTGVAIRGYDPVAYFTDGKPLPGRDEFRTEWLGATWKFASQDHLERFKAEPARYAPQYGGYCAYGVANGHLVKIEPEQWAIVDGRLYLNYDAGVSRDWRADRARWIREADAAFADLLRKE